MKLLRIDSPLMRVLNKIADIMIVNLLFIICSFPVITVGAAAVAAYKVTQEMVFKSEKGIIGSFFRAFRNNIKQASATWTIVLLLVLLLGYELYCVIMVYQQQHVVLLCACIVFAAVLLSGLCGYLLPLIARYENSLMQHLKNAFYLFWGNPLRSIILIVVEIIPVAVPFFFAEFFLRRIYFWLFLAFGLGFYVNSILMKPVFAMLEKRTYE